ncbi:hypothetical protein pb186bvf_008815 [Paramecium bursaria]
MEPYRPYNNVFSKLVIHSPFYYLILIIWCRRPQHIIAISSMIIS